VFEVVLRGWYESAVLRYVLLGDELDGDSAPARCNYCMAEPFNGPLNASRVVAQGPVSPVARILLGLVEPIMYGNVIIW
jgi:hypothetical protein